MLQAGVATNVMEVRSRPVHLSDHTQLPLRQSTPSNHVLYNRGNAAREHSMIQAKSNKHNSMIGSSPKAGLGSKMLSSDITSQASRDSTWRNSTSSPNNKMQQPIGNPDGSSPPARPNGYLHMYASAPNGDVQTAPSPLLQPPSAMSTGYTGTSTVPPGASGPQPTPSSSQSNPMNTSLAAPQLPPTTSSTTSSSPSFKPSSLRQRHALQVPTPKGHVSRNSTASTSDAAVATGRFSPTTTTGPRRASMSLARRGTKSMQSDTHVDELPQDEDAAKAAEAIIARRANKRRRKEDEEDDKVVVGTKVDINHVNWVTAYNMLTGIRFVVSRVNAKMDRPLTDADFEAKHKFSFDIAGNELTPSAKYDFKFKDYSPWVFRHLRTRFGLDPADYLMSLTSKYILSELGSPGKSGSFFYFSRDYKYIIKTIHHGEHLFLRRILREYYNHVLANPNTLISQFYGLHRVKTPFGRKIHFVVMNNLFPPHRDIHQTYDLKGSTVGRDYNEDKLSENPRATLKDLNWLRRNMHLELGPSKRQLFLEQVERDVQLLQQLHIMDYSLLIGIHDLTRGNKDDIRNNALKVFQPGANAEEDLQSTMLVRTPSKLENARKARELRKIINKEVPVTLDRSANRLPEESEPKNTIFYTDDGGFQATHENNEPGDVVYYLGIIDCLTHYGIVKKLEHFWRGLSNPKTEVSAIPPDSYGERFFKFISGVVKSKEEVEREKEARGEETTAFEVARQRGSVVDVSANVAQEEAEDSYTLNRATSTAKSQSNDRSGGATILPVVEETGEGSTTGRSLSRNGSGNDSGIGEISLPRSVDNSNNEKAGGIQPSPPNSRTSTVRTIFKPEPEDMSIRVTTVSTQFSPRY